MKTRHPIFLLFLFAGILPLISRSQNEFYNDGAQVYVQSAGLIFVQGEVINDDQGGNVGRIFNNGDVQLTGNWTNTSTSNVFQSLDAGTTTFLGNNAVQTIGGSTDTYFNNLTLNKPGGTFEVRQLRNSLCDGILNLSNDFLNTQNFTFMVSNPMPSAIQRTGPIVPNYTNSLTQGYVTSTSGSAGRLARATSNAFPGGIYLFPVGDATLFRPVEITPTSVGQNVYGVQFVHLPTPSTGSLGAGVVSVNPAWYHFLERAVALGSPENIRIYWDTFTETICNNNNMSLAEYDLSNWTSLSPTTTTVNTTPTLSFTQKTGYPGTFPTPWISNMFVLSDVAVGPWGTPCPLDGESVQLRAQAGERKIDLSWTSSTSEQAASFQILRSEDGIHYDNTGNVNANSGINRFEFEDEEVIPGQLYFYKVIQMDISGDQQHSNIAQGILLDEDGMHAGGLFPNPSRDGEASIMVHCGESGSLKASVVNSLGQEIIRQEFNLEKGNNTLRLPIENLAAGTYFVQFISSKERFVRKLIVE